MFSFLKNHPFPVEAFFKSSLVLTFAVPREEIENLIPPCLELDTFQNKWAFIAAAMVQTKDLRPKGLPKVFGKDFFLVGYRVFVKYQSKSGKRLRGLYILRSETDKKMMELLGNLFTHYEYRTTDICENRHNGTLEFSSVRSGFRVAVRIAEGEHVALPAGSPFSEWKDARRFAGPLPFTFTFDPASKKVLIIEGVRENWIPKPVNVLHYDFPFLADMDLRDIRLANAFIINDIPYAWKKGRIEQWEG